MTEKRYAITAYMNYKSDGGDRITHVFGGTIDDILNYSLDALNGQDKYLVSDVFTKPEIEDGVANNFLFNIYKCESYSLNAQEMTEEYYQKYCKKFDGELMGDVYRPPKHLLRKNLRFFPTSEDK